MHYKMFLHYFNVSKSIIILLSPIRYNLKEENIMLFSRLKLSVQPKG